MNAKFLPFEENRFVKSIIVEPIIEDKEKTIEVSNESDLKPDEVNVEPKLVEE